MNRILCLLFSVVVLSSLQGCARNTPRGDVIVTIGNYSLYRDDFMSELSLYPPAYREEFSKEQILNEIIQKKVLLLEAQRMGLDKDPQFMKMIERFWEQSLLRSLLEMKSREILSSIPETDKDRNLEAGEKMRKWVEELEKSTPVTINKEALEKIDLK